MSQRQGPTEERIRSAIEARIDRLIALEELSWELRSSIDDLWGPVPEAWSARVEELAAVIGREPLRGATGAARWEAGRARILDEFSPADRWLIGLSDHLWDHAFDGGREAIRRAAVESFLAATLAYLRDHPDAPPLPQSSSRPRTPHMPRTRGSRPV